jgi:predicted DNA-binding transcriptional regulator YafY
MFTDRFLLMRADRLLSILLLLQVNRRLTAGQLAKRLEVSERTILRDMDALTTTGVPVVADRGVGGGWSLMDEYQTKLTGLSAGEIQSLFLSRPSRMVADLGLKQESEAALIKLQASLPAAARLHAEFARQRILIDTRGWRDPSESAACLPILLDALWRNRQIRFLYAKVLCEPAERVAHPLGLIAKGSVWYLIAKPVILSAVEGSAFKALVASADAEPRTYRVSRIREVTTLDESSSRPPGFDLTTYWESSAAAFREQLPRYYASFRANPDIMRWVRYRGWRLEEERQDDDGVYIRVRFDADDEALQFALSFGDAIEVVEPPELRKKVIEAARAVMQRYQNSEA